MGPRSRQMYVLGSSRYIKCENDKSTYIPVKMYLMPQQIVIIDVICFRIQKAETKSKGYIIIANLTEQLSS